MGRYTIGEIIEITGATSDLTTDQQGNLITELSIDSRTSGSGKHILFFAIPGARHNGHQYISQAYQSGIRFFMISEEPEPVPDRPGICFLRVNNTLKALQTLAAFHRRQFRYPVLAITGSNGKTIVKEWLYQLMRNEFNIIRSPKSYNSQVGVPLSIWQMGEEHNLAILEAGISFPSEMSKLTDMIQPDLGLITNIGEAHAENFIDRQHKLKEKMALFGPVKQLFYCRDNEEIHEQARKLFALSETTLHSWSSKGNAGLVVSRNETDSGETHLQGVWNNRFIDIKIPFTDAASVENAVHCWNFMLQFGYTPETIRERMMHLVPVAMRLEMKEGINNCSIINDSYNSDVGSLSIALDYLNRQQQHLKKSVILSDILQTGKEENQLYSEVAALLHQKGINRLFAIGDALYRNRALFSFGENHFFQDTDDFLSSCDLSLFQQEAILIKGARIFRFEQISKALQYKAHATILEVNMNAVVHNLNYYKSLLHPQTRLMAMVKAFGYGSGSYEIASLLQFNRVNYLAVAYADEGVALRNKGIQLPIMVMNPEEQSFDNMITHNLEPELYSIRILQKFAEYVRSSGLKKFPVHIKLDTGMHRLGFDKKDIAELCIRLNNNRHLHVVSLFSHLAASDNPDLDYFTRSQLNAFSEAASIISTHLGYQPLLHLLNSAGISRFKDAQFDMVRLGIGLFGISSSENESRQLLPAIALKTIISQIKTLEPNETVSYNRSGKITETTTIATVPIGYADGFPRLLGNGAGYMLVNGKKAFTIGNICMDMTMLNISHITAKEGDEVEVFGTELPVDDVARMAGTIPYEILTSVSGRVKRVYYQE